LHENLLRSQPHTRAFTVPEIHIFNAISLWQV
jgi:hypothetical protein